ncbi:bifunctional 4-hydroxy-2-oxoglutarate aldolase/2-dehydro-3-deoxy-phosphogluconate aldolase [Actinoallomurus vinaceus]|uniref:Bifunctional 4-hydroxy-2-oxoglutarate aldolase/2-dehydro-3-deoxy-phosphogluconate aldolase n=1 Tax=Actinoallomurus vinaceus TaxID=1080074 RepID=A0ABP8U9M0_9ACTN
MTEPTRLDGTELLAALRARRILGIIRGRDPDASVRAAVALAEEGVDLLEVSLTGADALAVITRIRAELGSEFRLGAGTVLRAEDADAAAGAGASFAVTPAMGEGVTRAIERGMPVLTGALTPTELWQAHLLGATAVKIFPAAQHGPGYIRALRDPFPDVPLIPVGGVDAERAEEYLAAGAVAVGVASPLAGDAPHGGDLAALRERARRFRDAVAAWTT